MHRIFVYGTLMSGQRNHRLMAGAHFVRVARTAAEYTLRDLGHCPALVEGGTTAVRGELYQVDDETRAALDRFEGHPVFYVRRPLRLRDGADVEGYVLLGSRCAGGTVIASGDWRRRSDQR